MPGPIEVYFFKVSGELDRVALNAVLSCLPQGRSHVLIDRDSTVSELHVRSAFMHAARSILSGRSRAKDKSMEVLRYIAGSRQVGGGLSLAGPREGTEVLIVASSPLGWPSKGDGESLPEVRIGDPFGLGMDPAILEPSGGVTLWGGRNAAERILAGDPGGSDPEMAVLERIAMADLR